MQWTFGNAAPKFVAQSSHRDLLWWSASSHEAHGSPPIRRHPYYTHISTDQTVNSFVVKKIRHDSDKQAIAHRNHTHGVLCAKYLMRRTCD